MINIHRIKLEKIKNTDRFTDETAFLPDAIQWAVNKVEEVMKGFVHNFPSACSENYIYRTLDEPCDILGSNWTDGFWTGMLWLSYQLTGNQLFRAVAEAQFDDWDRRMEENIHLNHHDIGFLYMPSMVAQYKITGIKKSRKLALEAADILAKRYSPKARIIQVRDRDEQGNFIIDCSMNVPLLYWASIETGDRSYYLKALNHMYRVVECMIRDDASSYQCYKIDEVTGVPEKGWQGQGYDDHTCWARGQAWVIYGFALCYKYTKDKSFLELAKRVANYYINRLPQDAICNWDLYFTAADDSRDTSTAPIAACGLLEIAKYLEDGDIHKEIYKKAAITMIKNLSEKYTTQGLISNGLLKEGIYCKQKSHSSGLGDGECCLWGDYFYLEALLRIKDKDWCVFW